VTSVSAISFTKHGILFFALLFYFSQVSSYRNHLHRDLNLGQIFRVVVSVLAISYLKQTALLGTFLLFCLVYELKEPLTPEIKLRTIFQSFYLSKIFPCSPGVNMPCLVEDGLSLLKLQANTHIT
jgi:hypothetical protein